MDKYVLTAGNNNNKKQQQWQQLSYTTIAVCKLERAQMD